jgi:hypothetical protein
MLHFESVDEGIGGHGKVVVVGRNVQQDVVTTMMTLKMVVVQVQP